MSNIPMDERDPQRTEAVELLHELRVHQVELEMQNEELRRAQNAIEESRDRYVDLYEFAPIGYLTLTREGTIDEANLTAAALLQMEHKKLLYRRFARFVKTEENDTWYRHFAKTLQLGTVQSCEMVLQRNDASLFHAQLDCLHMKDCGTSTVRVALTDISERKHSEQELRRLLIHLQTIREEEKSHLAREIHDDLGSILSALKIEIHMLDRGLSAEQKKTPLFARVESMIELFDDALKATRRIITDLRPAILDDLGLMAAIEWQAEQFQKHTGIACQVECANRMLNGCSDCKDCRHTQDKALSIHLFRIFQESLTNVARHSGASSVEIKLQPSDHEVVLSISDNGCGLPEGHVIAPTSNGMRGMHERVKQLSGKIEFDMPTGGGFRVTVKLPQSA